MMLERSTLDQRLADAARRFPVGQAVLYRPVMGLSEQIASKIRSAPWALGHGAIVVAIEGKAGGVSVDHLTIAPEAK